MSSTHADDTAAALAVDGSPGTRWSSAWTDPQWIRVDLGATATITQVVLQWERAYGRAYRIETSDDGTTWTPVHTTANGTGGTETLPIIEQRSFRVVPPTVPGTNLARDRDVTASSHQPTGTNGPQLPAYAADGDYATRWASEWVDQAWLQVDLGSVQTFNHVQLAWEAAYATAYRVETSDQDGASNCSTASASSPTGRRPSSSTVAPRRSIGSTSPT